MKERTSLTPLLPMMRDRLQPSARPTGYLGEGVPAR